MCFKVNILFSFMALDMQGKPSATEHTTSKPILSEIKEDIYVWLSKPHTPTFEPAN